MGQTIRITSENGEYQLIQALKSSRAKRNRTGEAFIEGTECIKQAAGAGLEITRIITAAGRELSDWAGGLIAANPGARVLELAPRLYRALCDRTEAPELLVSVRIRRERLESLPLPERPFLLAFDRPSDPGNFGSAVRTANSFRIDAALIIGHGIDPWDPKAIRASLGSVFHTPIVNVESMDALERFIRAGREERGLRVLGTDSAGAAPLTECTLKRPLLIIIGNEAKGMSQALKALCDEVVRIPVSGAVNSLNAACAASIVMWEVVREEGEWGVGNRE